MSQTNLSVCEAAIYFAFNELYIGNFATSDPCRLREHDSSSLRALKWRNLENGKENIQIKDYSSLKDKLFKSNR